MPSENNGHRVQVLRYADGALVRGNGQFSHTCCGITIDSDGRMLVADQSNHRVKVLV
jgi:hypothetical protein